MSQRRWDADDGAGPKRAGASKTIRDAGLIEELRSARKRLRAISRRLAELDDRRDIAASELNDEVEQALIGLDLLEHGRRSASVAAFAAKLRRAASAARKTLNLPR